MLVMLVLLVASASDVAGHVPKAGKGTQCEVVFTPQGIRLTMDLSYDAVWSRAEMQRMDRNLDRTVSQEEADAYTEFQWTKRVEARFSVKVDGVEIALRKLAQRYEGPLGAVRSSPVSFYYDVEGDLPGAPMTAKDVRKVEITNRIILDDVRHPPLWLVPYEGHGTEAGGGLRLRPKFVEPQRAMLEMQGFVLEGSPLVMEVRFEEGTGPVIVPPGSRSPQGRPAGMAEVQVRSVRDAMARYDDFLQRDDFRQSDASGRETVSWSEIVGLLFLAIAWGAAHALGAGHTQAMASVHLVGARRRVRDAVALAGATTLTHATSVGLLGVTFFWMLRAQTSPEAELQRDIVEGAGTVSGVLLLAVGLLLFRKHWGRHHHHRHAGGDHSTNTPRFLELMSPGIAAGLAPWASGLVAISMALEDPARLPFALLLLVFFSLGMGSVLLAVGVFLVTGRALVAQRGRGGVEGEGRWARVMPVVTSLWIVGLGAYCIVRAAL